MFFEGELKQKLIEAGVRGDIVFSAPPKPEMGDLAFTCFGLAKEQGKNPVEVAKELAEAIGAKKIGIIANVKAFGPYVNFYLDIGILAKTVIGQIEKDKNYGANNIGQGEKVMIEYPSQNTHKEFHIGHLRNVCIGNTLVKLYEKSGYKMVPVNYINDFGAHVVKCLWWIMRQGKIDASIKNKQKWLGEMYAEASKYIKEREEEVRPELDGLQRKLEARDAKTMKLFKKTRKWSLDGFKKIHQELGVCHKVAWLENQVKDKGQKLVDELIKKQIATVGERGAIIVDLSKYDLDVALLRKSTGAGVYMTSDLALAEEKFKRFKVGESINITGTEQDFYFKQLVKILELSGFKNKITHIGYGLVNLPEGKMSSRAGNVVLYEDLRDEISKNLMEEMHARRSTWPKKKQIKVTNILTQAVLKFAMQQHEANKTIIFDIKQAISFDGFSAPYILYVVARINSLFKKSKVRLGKAIKYDLLQAPEEKKLLLLLATFGEVVEKGLKNYNPSVVTKYCFDLAQAFNEFYNRCPILNDADKELSKARLCLCEATKKVLVSGLDLLTIKTVEEM
jgi:arginyl-tRNA synthetase